MSVSYWKDQYRDSSVQCVYVLLLYLERRVLTRLEVTKIIRMHFIT